MNIFLKSLAVGAISLSLLNLLATNVYAVAGQWSSNGSTIYYNDGNVGMGVTNPTWKFQINTTGNKSTFLINGDGTSGTSNTRLFQASNGVGRSLTFHANGRVGIGTVNPSKTLSVNGVILAKEILVSSAASNWPDYVFEDEYNLMSLEEVEAFIEMNNHLPNIPSQEEIENDGISLGEMQRLHMEKIEELTLHMIEKDKEISDLKGENDELLKRLERVESILLNN